MELRHLKYFIAVAEELHFTRAADRLHIAQPPLSQQIKQLEEELGAKLFERSKRQVKLTIAGKAALEEARRTIAQAKRVAIAARRAERGEVGELSVGFSSSAPYTMLPAIIRNFRTRFAHVKLTLHERSTEDQIALLRAGAIDAGFVRAPSAEEAVGLAITPILREPLVAALPQGHRSRKQKQVAIGALKGEQFVLPPRHAAPVLYDQIVGLCRRRRFRTAGGTRGDADANHREPGVRRSGRGDRAGIHTEAAPRAGFVSLAATQRRDDRDGAGVRCRKSIAGAESVCRAGRKGGGSLSGQSQRDPRLMQ